VDYTFMHFDSEERLMERVAYPDLDAHKEVHLRFKERVKAIHQQFLEKPGALKAEEVLALVQDWFAHHILGEDMRFKPWVLVAMLNEEQAGSKGWPVIDALAEWVTRQQ
jgi:hemerythrin-like metal-binding protein